LIARVAPRLSQNAHFSAVRAVVRTFPPNAAATWIAAEPMPPD